jgi:endoglucanase
MPEDPFLLLLLKRPVLRHSWTSLSSSAVVRPSLIPSSMSAWVIQRCSVDSEMSKAEATSEPGSCLASDGYDITLEFADGTAWLAAAYGDPFALSRNTIGWMSPKPWYIGVVLLTLMAGSFVINSAGISSLLSRTATQGSRSTAPIPQVIGNKLVNAANEQVLHLQGVNVADTETACLKGSRISAGPLDDSEARVMARWHIDVVRIPLNEDCWLGINGVSSSTSGVVYQNAIRSFVGDLNDNGIIAVLDLHFTAPGRYLAREQWPLPDAVHSLGFWREVSQSFSHNPSVMFDPFNEPNLGSTNPTDADWQCWQNGCTVTYRPTVGCRQPCQPVSYQTAGMQQIVHAIRESGARQPILLAGLGDATVICKGSSSISSGCLWSLFKPQDPLHSIVANVHSYSNGWCKNEACWSENYAPLSTSTPIVATEVGESDCSASYVKSFTQWAATYGLSFLVWAWQVPTVRQIGCETEHSLLARWSGVPSVPLGLAIHNLFVRRGT